MCHGLVLHLPVSLTHSLPVCIYYHVARVDICIQSFGILSLCVCHLSLSMLETQSNRRFGPSVCINVPTLWTYKPVFVLYFIKGVFHSTCAAMCLHFASPPVCPSLYLNFCSFDSLLLFTMRITAYSSRIIPIFW